MPLPSTRPFGTWPSPIDIDLLTSGSVGLSAPMADDGAHYWLETRPSEKGRTVLVRNRAGDRTDVTGAPFNVRSGVHEYGGGAYTVVGGIVVFANFADARLYVIEDPGRGEPGRPRPITPDLPGRMLRYADLQLDLPRRRVLAVREDHRGVGEPGGPAECVNTIVRIDLDADGCDEGEILVDGHDFVSAPRLSPDGRRLLWYSWQHPDMPWDSSVLSVGDADAGDARQLDGGPGVSIADIGWLADGRPAWFSDRTGYWNLYVDGANVYPVDSECADPAWVFGNPGWAQTSGRDLIVRRHEPGGVVLCRIPIAAEGPVGSVQDLVTVAGADGLTADDDGVLFRAGFADRPAALVRLDLAGELEVLAQSVTETIDPACFSVAEPISWPAPDGATAHGYLYRPENPGVTPPDGEAPPLLVLSHGGPTGAASPALSLPVQYWTTRGFAVLDVNYGGSTGYGRAYRERLKDRWGIVDVDDCCSGAQYLAGQGIVDGGRMAIRGGSAGGYTTLAALAFREVFAAGVSRYGVGDLEALATDTHKFESRYLDGLIGPYPQARQTYLDRSPIHHVDGLDCALLLLQGTEDTVVPPNQATEMADAVRAKGRPVALRMYEDEGHGFRMADTIRDALGCELGFYGRVFGFKPTDEVPELDIDNLPG